MVTVTSTVEPNHQTASRAPERHTVVVIGGSQAGLAAGYHVARRGIDVVILDAHPRVGDAWRNRWDSLRLFTPSRFSQLPGMPFISADRFPTKDEMADYLELYAEAMHLPVRTSTRVSSVSRTARGAWRVDTDGTPYEADAVVIATGGYQQPKIPAFGADLDPSIRQIHSSAYRNPDQLQRGDVLVVGASTSGAEIAIEAAWDHHTILAGRDTGEIPFRTERPVSRAILPVLWFVASHVLTVDTPVGRKVMPHVRAHGGPLVRVKRSDVAASGVEHTTARVAGVSGGKPMLDDGRVLDVRNVVWSTGFHGDYSWVEGLTIGADGYPEQDHGIATAVPGVTFVGLKFQRSFASMLVGGVGRDAAYIADHIAASARVRTGH